MGQQNCPIKNLARNDSALQALSLAVLLKEKRRGIAKAPKSEAISLRDAQAAKALEATRRG
jgi:hypothetical protein